METEGFSLSVKNKFLLHLFIILSFAGKYISLLRFQIVFLMSVLASVPWSVLQLMVIVHICSN